jgi:hypothetical protein
LLPHVRVALTVTEPGPRLDALREKNGAKKPDLWGRIRYDLMDDASFDDRQAAEEHVREMQIRLARQGYAVNGRADIYRTYVIELDGSKMPDHLGWLYVGQTAKPVAERIEPVVDSDTVPKSPRTFVDHASISPTPASTTCVRMRSSPNPDSVCDSNRWDTPSKAAKSNTKRPSKRAETPVQRVI